MASKFRAGRSGLYGIFASLLLFVCDRSFALPTAVLSNFNQPAQGGYLTLTSLEYFAVPFVSDSQFTQLDGVEINATTLLPPGNVFVQIWDMDAFGQPGNVVGTLSGPTDPAGLSRYSGTIGLVPDTSYFLVIGAGNGAGSIGTALFAVDGNQADSQPPPIYRIGTDFDGDGAINFVNKCQGSATGSGANWVCGGLLATRFFPEFRLLAEVPVPIVPPTPPSLTSSPLFLDFGIVTQGVTSAPLVATIENDGGVDQSLGNLALASGTVFGISSDACSGTTLAVGATCAVGLTFTPNAGGQFSDTLLIPVSTDPGSPYGLPLVGEGDIPPVQSLKTTPVGIDFGAVDQGSTSTVVNLQVENNGNVDQTLGTLSVTGPFTIATDSCSGITLTAAATCTVGVNFEPLVAGLASGALQIPATGDTRSPYNVPLAGQGTALPPNYSLTSTPLALDFGLVPDGSTSAPQAAAIQNDGNVTQVIGAITVGAGFSIVSDGCSGTTLVPGATCSIGITFSPPHGGTTAGTAVIPAASDPRSPYGLVLVGESDQPGTALPPLVSTEPRPVPVPMRFTFLTALFLLCFAFMRLQRISGDQGNR